jgi:hypothetical protein
MLVGIEMGIPRQSKQLPEEQSKLETEAGAIAGTVGGTSKFYFRRKEGKKVIDGLDLLKKFQNEWRLALKHYARYPFAAGMYILPAALVPAFMEENNKFLTRKSNVWNKWVEEQWPHWSATAQQRMGKFYDASDFPTLVDCMERFTCNVSVLPLADSDKWNRITIIAPALADMMRQRQDAAVDKVVKETHKKLWEDIMSPLNHVVEMLGKDKTRLHQSLIDNVIAICDLVPAYNEVHNDMRLEELAAKTKEAFSKIDIELLRQSAEARAKVIEETKLLMEDSTPYSRSIIMDDDEPAQEQEQGTLQRNEIHNNNDAEAKDSEAS